MAKSRMKADTPIEVLLREKRKFPPPKAFQKRAVVQKLSMTKYEEE